MNKQDATKVLRTELAQLITQDIIKRVEPIIEEHLRAMLSEIETNIKDQKRNDQK